MEARRFKTHWLRVDSSITAVLEPHVHSDEILIPEFKETRKGFTPVMTVVGGEKVQAKTRYRRLTVTPRGKTKVRQLRHVVDIGETLVLWK